MKRTILFLFGMTLVCSSCSVMSQSKRKRSLKVFMYAVSLGIPVGIYQEFSRHAHQGQAIASLGIGSIIFPLLAFLNRTNKHESEEDTNVDTALTISTAGAWGGAMGYFGGLLCGSLARLYVGRDTVDNSRALLYAWRMSESFFYGAGETLFENIGGQITQRIFG